MEPLSPQPREARWVGNMSQRVAMLALTTRNVSTDKENLTHTILSHFAGKLDSLAFLLKEMQRDAEVRCADYSRLEKGRQLDDEVGKLEIFLDGYAERSNLYLLSSCPHISRSIQSSSKRLGEVLECVLPKAGTTAMKLRIAQVKEAFQLGSPKLDAKQQTILDSLEPEMIDSIVADPIRSTKLVKQIADSLELTVDSEQFSKELKKLKKDQESVEHAKGKAHTLFLDQFVSLLEKAVAVKSKPASKPTAGHSKPLAGEVVMRSTPFSPLQSFICPITRDVMQDPVQIASGQTFERAAIERWFSEGHTRCPMGEELKNTKMKANIALRQSIDEWKERNYEIRIQNAGDKLLSGDLDDQENAVMELQRICEERNMNKYTITSKGLLIPLIRLAEKQKFELRKKTFAALRTLAEDNDENQEIMVREGIIDIVVRCLARKYDESEQAVFLLRLLSAKPDIAERISHAHGAVLLLVTLLGSEHEDTASSVKVILENLPTTDENIVIMAEANLMKPLVARLIEGSTPSRITMAKTLKQLQMPEASKIQTATKASIQVLLNMSESFNEEEKEAAMGALENLSTTQHVCRLLTNAQPNGAEVLMARITATKSTTALKVGAARVIANIMTRLADKWEPAAKKGDQVDWLVSAFLQLTNPFAPATVQAHVLRGLLGVANGADTGALAKSILKEREAFPLLTPFLTTVMDAQVKKNAVQIFASLSSTYPAEATATLKEQNEALSHIVEMLRKDSKADAQQIAAVTILANLPVDDANVTTTLIQADCMPLIVRLMNNGDPMMEEAAVGALLRFTSPKLRDLQLKLAGEGVVQRCISLLDSDSALTKERASRALSNFSKSSSSLKRPIVPRSCFGSCFSPRVKICPVHNGECKTEMNFCLKEADAIGPLLSVLKEGEPGPSEAAMEALHTLLDESLGSIEPGCHLIAKAKGVPIIVNLLNTGTPTSQQVAIVMLEKIFRLQIYREEYGPTSQMHIITVAQRGNSKSKQTAGKILRQLELLHSQSHYFTNSQAV